MVHWDFAGYISRITLHLLYLFIVLTKHSMFYKTRSLHNHVQNIDHKLAENLIFDKCLRLFFLSYFCNKNKRLTNLLT